MADEPRWLAGDSWGDTNIFEVSGDFGIAVAMAHDVWARPHDEVARDRLMIECSAFADVLKRIDRELERDGEIPNMLSEALAALLMQVALREGPQ